MEDTTSSLELPRTPSPASPITKYDYVRLSQENFSQELETSSPCTPLSATTATPVSQDTPITPLDFCTTAHDDTSIPFVAGVQLKSKQLQDHINTKTREASEAQILLFQDPGPFAQLKFGDVIGRGQWSKVYTSWISESRTMRPDTAAAVPSTVYAAKVADGRSAVKVIRHEARILTHLTSRTLSEAYVAGFFGYNMQHNALILEHLMPPRALKLLEALAKWRLSLQAITRGLVDGLDFLHAAGVVHGDIKPENIFVRRVASPRRWPLDSYHGHPTSHSEGDEIESYTYQPIYCDFSASRFDNLESNPTESAGTYDFMAPELFTTSAQRSFPTTASDVFALGLTLITTAAGASPFDTASSAIARRAMAMQGTPLAFLSADMHAWRKFESSHLQPWVQKAISKEVRDRWTARQWRVRLRSVLGD